jgi:hypothetical protein
MVEKISTEKLLKNTQTFICKNCNYTTCKKSSWAKHLTTDKHLFKKVEKLPVKAIKCDNCDKTYKDKSGLWYHLKKCKSKINIIEKETNIILNTLKDNYEFQELMIQQNQEFKKTMLEQNQELTKKLIEVVKEPKYVTNNMITNNNKFNLNFFLNEQCKDALNITDFVSSLTLQLTELEQVGQLGYVEGISKIFIRGLKELDVYKRPIHCSDIKREVLYIKDENNWEKDNEEKEKMKQIVNKIAHKNIKNIAVWIKENPNSLDLTSKKNDEYLQIVNKSMGGEDEIEREQYAQKIIKNIAKEIVIDK